jgi:hypothetical protein
MAPPWRCCGASSPQAGCDTSTHPSQQQQQRLTAAGSSSSSTSTSSSSSSKCGQLVHQRHSPLLAPLLLLLGLAWQAAHSHTRPATRHCLLGLVLLLVVVPPRWPHQRLRCWLRLQRRMRQQRRRQLVQVAVHRPQAV